MTAEQIGGALLLLGALLFAGQWLRMRWRVVQSIFLPASIVAGLLGLLLGPGVLGAAVTAVAGEGAPLAGGAIPGSVRAVWRALPGLLINVVFASLLLGVPLPRWQRIWHMAGPQLSFGLTLATGQYVVGIALVALVLAPLFGLPIMAGALIEIGFEGGHGTAAGLQSVFGELGYADGGDLAVGMATVGVISGIVFGIVLVNWGRRSGRSAVGQAVASGAVNADERRGLFAADAEAPHTGHMTVRPESIEPLTLHFALIAFAILIGYGILQALVWFEASTWGGDDGVALLAAVPLFPLTMLGGLVVQQVLQWTGRTHLLDRPTVLRLQGLALDVLIAAAIASLSLKVIAANIAPFVVLGAAGVAWNVGMFVWVAPRMIPRYWFERGIGDFGQSMGVTATGLVLMKIADPENRSPAYEAFGYKQLLFEPFFGGGLVTGLAVPLLYQFGAWPLFVVMLLLLIVAMTSGLLYFGRLKA